MRLYPAQQIAHDQKYDEAYGQRDAQGQRVGRPFGLATVFQQEVQAAEQGGQNREQGENDHDFHAAIIKMRRGRVFRPQMLAWALLLCGLLLFGTLGRWQVQRGQAKAEIISQRAAALQQPARTLGAGLAPGAADEGAHLRVPGGCLVDRQLLLDNQIADGRVGYRVWTPLDRGADQPLVLVDRGWVAGSPHRERLPELDERNMPPAAVGIWRSLPQPGLRLDSPACDSREWPRRVNYPDQIELECILGRPLAPGLLLLDSDVGGGFRRAWTELGIPPERHYGYALQWFALAAAALGLFLTLNWKPRDD